jgi:hypothetical protein
VCLVLWHDAPIEGIDASLRRAACRSGSLRERASVYLQRDITHRDSIHIDPAACEQGQNLLLGNRTTFTWTDKWHRTHEAVILALVNGAQPGERSNHIVQ